jgi:hypothetical protein
MQTAWIVTLKQNAEHCDPFSFFMPHALVFVLPSPTGANGSQFESGFTQTTCSKIRMQEAQLTLTVQVTGPAETDWGFGQTESVGQMLFAVTVAVSVIGPQSAAVTVKGP